MKLPSKSMLSPGRARDSSQSQISLSTSLSRRLRNSVSLKRGQASPMFTATTNGKKRGSSFENPEPTSPKVTCIGQVRVKTKKQGKKKMMLRAARSRREVSFRRTVQGTNLDFGHTSHHQVQQPQQECLPYRNQRWVHFPVTICEALRAFGAELSCILPCRSSCMESNNNKQRDDKGGKVTTHQSNGNGKANGSDSSCGDVFVRWLVVEEEQRNGSDNDEDDMPRRSQRRHVFEDILIEGDDNKCEQKNEILEEEEEEERGVSICIPPKNALLLMRCRSDPVKMAALANRFWECPPLQDEDENKEEEEDTEQVKVEPEHHVICEKLVFSNQIIEEDKIPDAEAVEEAEIEAESKEIIEVQEEEEEEEEEEEIVPSESFTEAPADPGLLNENENVLEDEQAFDDINEKRPSLSCQQEAEAGIVVVAEEDSTEEDTEKVHEISEPGDPEMTQEPETGQEKLLPDCLLLMMCEPKLSMEVSKETWVCSTDFVRRQPSEKKPPPEKVNKTDGSDEQPRKRASIGAAKPAPQQRQLLMQPPRSSCSFPAAPPLPPALGAPSVRTMNIIIEQKLVGAKPSSHEPFALTRCKSEPRKSSAKLAPETCFWKNRKIEPHRPATLGIGAAGVGF